MRKRSEAIRENILGSAKVLFLSQGYVATTVDAIAERAAVTKRTIYGYFPDKRAIFTGVIEDAVAEPFDLQMPFKDLQDTRQLGIAFFTLATRLNDTITEPDYVQLLRVAIAEVNAQPDLEALFEHGATRRTLSVAEELLIAANSKGLTKIKDPEIVARMFVGCFVVQVLLDGLLQPTSKGMRKLTIEELNSYLDEFMAGVISTKERGN
jgi:TetR/AcrR family transcriptional regulator, mexJK operon transcriptional repressor